MLLLLPGDERRALGLEHGIPVVEIQRGSDPAELRSAAALRLETVRARESDLSGS